MLKHVKLNVNLSVSINEIVNLMELTSVKILLKRKSKYCSKVFETQFIKHITLMKKNMKILKMFLNVGFLGR